MQQLVAPVLQLCGQGLNSADLFNFQDLHSCGAVVAKVRVWQLNDQIGGAAVDVFAEPFKDLDCSTDLGSGWRMHNQI